MKKLILPFLLIALLAGCTPQNDEPLQYEGTGFGMDEISKENTFKTASMSDLIRCFQKKETGIFYLGFEECPWCKEAAPILNKVADSSEMTIQYIQTRNQDGELLYTEEQKSLLLPYIKNHLNKDDEGEYKIYVPFLIVVKDGKVTGSHIGTVDGHDAHEREMTIQEKTDLQKIYSNLLTTKN